MDLLPWAPSSSQPTFQSSGQKSGALVFPLCQALFTTVSASGANWWEQGEKKNNEICSHTLGNHSFSGALPQRLRCLSGHQYHSALLPIEFPEGWVGGKWKRGDNRVFPPLSYSWRFSFSLHRPDERASLGAFFLCTHWALLGLGLPLSPVWVTPLGIRGW